jgi:hypothetical protein
MKKSGLLGLAYACLLTIGSVTPVSAVSLLTSPVSGQGTWETTLQARDLDGNPSTVEAYYDTVLNITWLPSTVPGSYDINWNAINDLFNGLDINGVTGWRLPTMADTGSPGCDFAYGGTD